MANGDLLIPGSYEEQLAQARALQNRAFQQATAQIDPRELEALAKRRALGGVEQEGMGAMMTAQGPEALRPLGRAMQARGLEAREPWEAGGGILHEGRFTADPEKGRERLTRALAAQAQAARGFAEEGEQQQGRVLQRAIQRRTLNTPIAQAENWQRLSDDTLYNQVTGETRPVTGGAGAPGAAPPKLTETQTASMGYGRRVAQANQVLDAVGADYSPIGIAARTGAANIPVVGGMAGMVGNAMLSKNSQLVEQAQRNFINAVLRRESGAVISDSEFNNARQQYFPQPGDDPATIEQKRANRLSVMENFRLGAGPGARYVAEATQPSAPGAAGPAAPRPGTPGGRRVEDRARSYGWQD